MKNVNKFVHQAFDNLLENSGNIESYSVRVLDGYGWAEMLEENDVPIDSDVMGLTVKESKKVFVFLPENWTMETLAHEMAHVLQIHWTGTMTEEYESLSEEIYNACVMFESRHGILIDPRDCL